MHVMPAWAVQTQLLGALGDRPVMLLQIVLVLAGEIEPGQAALARAEVRKRSERDQRCHDQEQWPRQHSEIDKAAGDDDAGDQEGREIEGEIADRIDVLGQDGN